jgi:hypothetical protein
VAQVQQELQQTAQVVVVLVLLVMVQTQLQQSVAQVD